MKLNFFISVFNQAISSNMKSCIIRYTRTNEKLLKVFLVNGFINGFSIRYKINKIVIYFKYRSNKNIIHKLVQLSKPGRRIYINSKMFRTKYRNIWYLISNSNGFLLIHSSAYTNLNPDNGGELLLKISI